ncbi:alpha/beta hydrolase [Chitinimonas sp.]|uniref:alpha/beta hydrolase n=1 Tax=Chitinimonas sp. TaxID=1934313 RepID=UPI002F91C879
MQVTENHLEIVESPPAGARRRPPLLFVHGAYGAAWCWQPNFLPYFSARGYHGYALSLRGHGHSEGRDTLAQASVADYVADVRRVAEQITALHGCKPILLGHSMGGFVALACARELRLAGLALLASVPPGGLLGSAMHMLWQHPQLLWELNLLQHGGRPPHLEKLRELLFSEGLDEATLLGYASRFQHESDRALLEMTLPQWDQRPPLGLPPVLVLGSDGDKLMPTHLIEQTAMQLGVPAQHLDGMGHMLMLDQAWPLAASAVASWLETLP